MGTARLGEDAGDWIVGEEFRPDLGEDDFFFFVDVFFDCAGMLPSRAAGFPVACCSKSSALLFLSLVIAEEGAITAQILIPHPLYPLSAQSGNHFYGIMLQQLVVVPCDAMRVHEDVDVGQLVVVVNDVREIDHDFMPFVLRWMKLRRSVVYTIDCRVYVFVVAEILMDPRYVLFFRFRDDNHFRISSSHCFECAILEICACYF